MGLFVIVSDEINSDLSVKNANSSDFKFLSVILITFVVSCCFSEKNTVDFRRLIILIRLVQSAN